ncbi:hypothetical protein C3L33_17894, partial [Rhododendron williamsianum]
MKLWRRLKLLMVLGFISLILVFCQYYIAEICIPIKVANTMLPCKKDYSSEKGGSRRRLLWYEHRMLASKESKCKKVNGEVPIISVDALHQLHILIFFLAVLHVLYSAVTMGLGRLKIRGWKQWEQETESHDYEFSNVLLSYVLSPEFLDDVDSPVLWASFVVFLLLNVSGWQALYWAALIPLFIILAVGTKLQAILTKMALEIKKDMQLSKEFLLCKAQTSTFGLYEFDLKDPCFHDNYKLVIGKIALGVGMGSHMKKSIFDEQTSKALKKWHNAVKKRTVKGGKSPARTPGGGSPTASVSSTLHSAGTTLHRFMTTGHSTRPFTYETDPEQSDYEAEPLSPTSSTTTNLIVRVDNNVSEIELSAPNGVDENRNVDDFSFVKPVPLK